MYEINISLDSVIYKSKPTGGDIGKINNRIAKGKATLKTPDGIKEFAERVGKHGATFCPATFSDGLRKKANFEQTQLLALDFDNGISFDKVKERAEKYDLPILFAYDTFSSMDNDRFRVVFLNDTPIENAKAAEMVSDALLTMFPEADKSCGDISKMYFGGKELLHYDESLPEVNIESIFRNMTIFLYDMDAPAHTHYKNKIKQFASKNKIALTQKGLLDVSIAENPPEEENGKISPSSIIIPKRMLGENLPNRYYIINHIENYTNISSGSRKTPKNHAPYRSSTLEGAASICRLLREFGNGSRKLHHNELFGLATNIIQIETGAAWFCDVLSSNSYFEDNTEKYDKWKKDLRFMIQNDYREQNCEGFCPYKSQCRHGKNILSTTNPKTHTRIAGYTEEYVSLKEAEEDLDQALEMAIEADDNGVYVIKAQTAAGKTRAFIDRIKGSSGRFLIAVSSNDLKHEILERVKEQGMDMIESPSLKELNLPDEVESRIDHLYDTGRHRKVIPYIKKVISEDDPYSADILSSYLKELDEFKDSSCHAVTTHKKLLYMDEKTQKKYDTVLIDEDIILKGIVSEKVEIPCSELMKVYKTLPHNSELAKKIKMARERAKEQSYFQLPSIEFDDEYEGISNAIDIPSFCKAEYFYCNKISEADNIKEKWLFGDSLIFYKPISLKKNIKYIIVSATADEFVYKSFFGEGRVKFYECKRAENEGALYQDVSKSLSRSCIRKDPGVLSRIKTLTGFEHSITFKEFVDNINADMSYGNTEGRDHLKGQDIVVIGTPHYPEWMYKLFAFTFGLDVNLDEPIKRNRPVVHNGYRFRFTTFDDEGLRKIQFWMIESELEQAVGRARLLRCKCDVILFSNFPLRQAVIKGYEYG